MISFPYTSVKTMSGSTPQYDRAINSSIKRLYNKLRYTQGVAVDIGDGFRVVADTGMNLRVLCNGAWAHVGGNFCYEDDIEKSLTIQAADANNDRIDRIVIRNDISQEVRAASFVVVKGTASSSPTPPALTNTSEIQEICLADIMVKRGATSIATENITDKRLDKSVCGVLSNAFGDIDTSQFFSQMQSLIDNLKDEIEDINQGSEVMLKATYDPGEHGIDITIQPYTHSLSGGVHTLTGQGNVIQFTATGDFTSGNTFNVNGTVCTAKTVAGDALWTGFFKSGATLMCLRNGNKLTFNGGGLPSAEVAKLVPGNIKTGISVEINGNTVTGTFTADGNASAADVAPGKIAYSKGNKLVGTFTSDSNAVASAIRSGYSAYVNGKKITGTIPSKGASTITPKPYDQSISSGQYLSGNQTIKGDSNLAAQNIRSGKSIFGVSGNLQEKKAVASVGYGRIFCYEVGDPGNYLPIAASSGWADSGYGQLGYTGIHGYGFGSETNISWKCTRAGSYTITSYGSGAMNRTGTVWLNSGDWVTMEFSSVGDIYWRDSKSGGFLVVANL